MRAYWFRGREYLEPEIDNLKLLMFLSQRLNKLRLEEKGLFAMIPGGEAYKTNQARPLRGRSFFMPLRL